MQHRSIKLFITHTKLYPRRGKLKNFSLRFFFGVDAATFEQVLSENEKLSAIIFLLMCCKHVQLLVIGRSVLTARVRRHMPRQITHSGIVVRCFVAVSLYRLICPTGCLRYAHTKRNRNRQNHKIKQRRERNLIASGGFHASFLRPAKRSGKWENWFDLIKKCQPNEFVKQFTRETSVAVPRRPLTTFEARGEFRRCFDLSAG